MILFHRLKSLALWIFRRREVEERLSEDIESFVELSAAAKVRQGETPAEARRRARLEIGGMDQTRERVRSSRWGWRLEEIRQDLRYAVRSMASQRGFTGLVILTLAIGIGANTAVYSVVDATMLRTLPFKEPERLMRVSLTTPPNSDAGPQPEGIVWSYPKYEMFRKNQDVFESTSMYRPVTLNLTSGAEAERLRAEEVSAGYFPLLGVEAAIGRTFLVEEDVTPGKDLVALISDGLWRRQFGGDPAIVGKTIGLDLQQYTVVGVLPPGFQGLEGPADVWVTVHRDTAESLNQPWAHAWQVVSRLKSGVTTGQAKSTVASLGKAIDEAYRSPGGGGAWGAQAAPLNDGRLDPAIRESVLVLFGAVLFVVLIACVNVANLLLVRGSARGREIAIRSAIGAGRARVMRQLLTESLMLAILGGVASLVVADVGVRALSKVNPAVDTFTFGRPLSGLTLLGFNSIRMDSSALVFTFVTALVAGIAFGLAPAWHTARADVSRALKKDSGRSSGYRFMSAKNVLVVVEVALALVLLAGAGLMLKSLSRLTAAPIGVDPNNVLTVRLSLQQGPEGREASIPFFTELERRVEAQPGVISAGVGSCPALAGFCGRTIILFRDRPAVPRGSEPAIPVLRVSPDYFKTMRIPVVRGRAFNAADDPNAPKVAVVNESAARRFWPGENPVGKSIGLGINGFGDSVEVIGVVGDVRYGPADQPAEPNAYLSYKQGPSANMVLFARTEGNSAALAPIVRREAKALNPSLPVYDVKTMQERLGDATARMRFNAILLGVFAVIAVVLAAVGIFGVMSYVIRQSFREIGIRMALGARSRDVVLQGVGRTGLLVLAGAAIGLPGALAATRVLRTSLYQVTPADPPTYVAISILLGGVALLAGYIPARRASTVEPSITLKSE